MKKINNGGAIAEKGFNYQSVVGVFIMFNNYKNDTFSICFENADDIEVLIDNYHIFLQVKSSSELKPRDIISNKDNPSILLKLWDKNDSDNFNYRYKLVTPNFKIMKSNEYKSIRNDISSEGIIFDDNVYSMKSYIELPLELEEYISKLDNSYFVITPFYASLKEAQTYLKGVLDDCEITIGNGIGQQIFEELFTLVKKKSQILIKDEKTSFDKKSINSSQIQRIINKGKEFEELKFTSLSILDEIKDNLSKLLRINIRTSINSRIDDLLKVNKDTVKNLIGDFELDEDLPNLIINKLYPVVSNIGLLSQDIYTIVIALVADKINRQKNDN